jgi:hypothetical protein
VSNGQTTRSAPVLPFEYPADEEPIWPCHDCLPWHLEIVYHPETGAAWVREWHAIGCKTWSRNGNNDEVDH